MCESCYEPFKQLFEEHGLSIKLFPKGFIVGNCEEFVEFINKMFWSRKYLNMIQNDENNLYVHTFLQVEQNKDDLLCSFITLFQDIGHYDLCSSNLMFSSLSLDIKNNKLINEKLLFKESIEEFLAVIDTLLKIYSACR